MRKKNSEKRRCKRLLFTVKDGMIGPISLNNGKRVNLNIMNLSVGGLQGFIKKAEADDLEEGEIIRLEGIAGAVDFHLTGSVQMKIKWLMDANLLAHTGMGCEFLDLPEALERQIGRFVDSERLLRGQCS
ncbi:MAG: hypothetical protein GY859_38315 [Desulfobacterales bacterium]|nr:hypothetical protein [Desulfobacterales bacterium]